MTQTGPDQDPLRHATWRRRAAIIAAAAAIFTLAGLLSALAAMLLGGTSDSGQLAVPLPSAAGPSASTSPTRPPATPTPSPTPSPTRNTPAPTRSPTPTASEPVRQFKYQPLWPFTSEADAAAWQRTYRNGGQQPWHLDADQTALSFTTGYLGLTEINKVVRSSIRGDDAQVSVGYLADDKLSVSAVLHLVRIGQGTDAPWEVVGTTDSTFTLDRPRYAGTVTSPLTVSGLISGVDESIRVEVRQPSSDQPIGTRCCVPAGGDRQPWTTEVTFKGATAPALTIIASTGGHVQSVERFAITAVRPSN
ncbi:MAG TPA: hypothetical protein VFG33_29240 [Kribbella sp.]|uniref:hypothetical protein n=1 Tax=Kribbella sp. TaxID=1871183 RepID=UPI002D788457|nr:hypothetical protein [Kribbella sp.]HET6297504.1 hypothetical protein [Kribbella sp.]